MPNDCSCTVRVSAEKSTIDLFKQTEFSFQALYTPPEFPPLQDISGQDERWYEWNCENWGTKWDRYNFHIVHQGSRALQMNFTTAWAPPYPFFEYLLKKFPDLWLKCDWIEEGGQAGVFIGYTEEGEVQIKNIDWPDWCIEMYASAFAFEKERERND